MNPHHDAKPAACSPALRRKVLGESRQNLGERKGTSWLKKAAVAISRPKRKNPSRNYSNLSNSANEDTETRKKWLHSEQQVLAGIAYNVTYLGSREIGALDRDYGNRLTLTTDIVRKAFAGEIELTQKDPISVSLEVSPMKITVSNMSSEVLFRHSVIRVAFSSADVDDTKKFFYVSTKKGTNRGVIHIFGAQDQKQGLELTFTMAQAFEMSFEDVSAGVVSGSNVSLLEPTMDAPGISHATH
eukprot:m.698438 g.698438  ORF g.698438 m.698438 type:complete len:243 (-) comp22901_c1_seq4:2880-3608(-)